MLTSYKWCAMFIFCQWHLRVLIALYPFPWELIVLNYACVFLFSYFSLTMIKYHDQATYKRNGLFRLMAPEGQEVSHCHCGEAWCWSSKLRVHVLNCKPKAERQREQEQEHWDWNKAFCHKATYSIRPSPTPLHSGTYRIVSSTGEQVFKWPRLQETFVIRTITFWSIYSNVLPIWNVQC